MTTKSIKLNMYRCVQCEHTWNKRKNTEPRMCPKCKSIWWDEKKDTQRIILDRVGLNISRTTWYYTLRIMHSPLMADIRAEWEHNNPNHFRVYPAYKILKQRELIEWKRLRAEHPDIFK